MSLYGNIYRRAWFELNFIYFRFICLFESELYNNYEEELDDIFSNMKMDVKNCRLVDIPDTRMSRETGLKSIYDTLKMDYDLAEKSAKYCIDNHFPHKCTKWIELLKNNLKK